MSARRKHAILEGVGRSIDVSGSSWRRPGRRRVRMSDLDRIDRDLVKVTGDFGCAFRKIVIDVERR